MDSISEELVKIIKEKTSNKNTAAILSDILLLNSEAIYRRLRGQVPFTLDEATKICQSLNISLDLLTGIKNHNRFTFHMDTFHSEDPLLEYREMLIRIAQNMESLKSDPSVRLYRAHKTIPQEFLYNYEKLSRAYTYILYYQLHSHKPNVKKMADFPVAKDIFPKQKRAAACAHEFESMIILDKAIVFDYINIVLFFFELGMITQEEIGGIKKELFLMVADLEKCADSGKSLKGVKLDMYLSHISIDCNYNCVENDIFSTSAIGIYCIDYLSCENKNVFDIHKSWIMSLRKFSILISVADELTRKNFFEQQRQLINTML